MCSQHDTMRPLHNQWFRDMMYGLGRRDMKLLHDLLQTLKFHLRSQRRRSRRITGAERRSRA